MFSTDSHFCLIFLIYSGDLGFFSWSPSNW